MRIDEKGFTLVETVMAVAVSAAAILGLTVVYVFGIDAWDKTLGQVRLQQSATLAAEALEQSLSNAKSILVEPNRLTVSPAAPDTLVSAKRSVFELRDGRLYRDNELLIPFNEEDPEIRLTQWVLPRANDSLWTVRLYVSRTTDRFVEPLTMDVRVYPRNRDLPSPFARNSSEGGT